MVTLGTNLPGGGTGRGTGSRDWFAALAASPRPAVVDYAGGGDRVELSGRVLANWGAKTANLVDSEGHGPEATVLVDLPLDWTSLAVLLGLARAGVGLVFPGEDGGDGQTDPADSADLDRASAQDADLVLTSTPGDWAEHPADLWVVGAGPDAASDAEDAAPAHAVDFLTEVRMQADQCHLPLPGGAEGLPGLAEAWKDLRAPDLADAGRAQLSRRERGLVVAAAGARLDRAVASAAAGVWDQGLPVVLVPERTAPFSVATARQVEAEGVGSPA
ncbi:TIGR03089 family protein [Citricoccus nitrophenolicus]|uniref:TIGR03089 family protein n=1 Tax=Citricoccus nitrophenolicus TaxID=863575 RepID=UPI0031ED227A